MTTRILKYGEVLLMAIILGLALVAAGHAATRPKPAGADGIVKVASAYPMAETIDRIKRDIAAKGITFFAEVDQRKLAADAGITLRPSMLLMFGNPALGSQFMTSNPVTGLDWPVRLLILEDADGKVWAAYTDFGWIARRHGVKDRGEAFRMASEVIASITSSIE